MIWVLDRITLAIALGAVFIRFGNFMNSEILGKVTTSKLGIKFIQDTYSHRDIVNTTGAENYKQGYKILENNPEFAPYIEQVMPKHPAQLYEAVGYVFIFMILYFLYWKTNVREKAGYLFGVFLVLLWSVRFFVEFVKESQGGFEGENPLLSTGQWLSIPFIIVGIYLMMRVKKQKVA